MKRWIAIRRGLSVAAALLVGGSVAWASPWTLPGGEFYGRMTLLWTRSHWQFNNASGRVRFLKNGVSEVAGASLDGACGLRENLMVFVGVPVLFYRLRDDESRQGGKSLGDIRFSTRYRLVLRRVAAAVEAAVKFPTATQVDPTRIQMGEGQYDFEGVAAAGFVWPSVPVYSSADVGYRLRLRSGKTDYKPGDEFFYRLDNGYQAGGRLSLRLSVDGFVGGQGHTKIFGVDVPARFSKRYLLRVIPGLTFALKERVGLDLSGNLPLLGRNNYAGSQVFVAVSYNSAGARASLGQSNIPIPQTSACCRVQ